MQKFFFGLLMSVLLWSAPLGAQSGLQRVEPAFWWAGMKNPSLQLLVYGPQISALTPVINQPGVRLVQTIHTENPNYLFIDLDLRSAVPGTFTISFQEKGKTRQTYAYTLHERASGAALRKGFSTADVMYLITPDRFANGNPANDNVPALYEQANRSFQGGRHGGDIQGIRDRLDYIRQMGFTAIWLNPLLENNQREYSYHGYSTTDFYAVDARYGNNNDYLQLMQEAHQRGIKVIMDMIVNHCGSEHWWMKDLPASDWINYGGKFVPTSHRRETVQDPYAAASDKQAHSDGWFVETMPDLNQRNPLMATYLIQNTLWWIEYAGLDGIRMDTYPYPDKDFMSEWTRRVMEEYPHFNIVGEEWTSLPSLVSFWQRGKVNANGYVSYLPSLMDFPVQDNLRQALLQDENAWESGFVRLYQILAQDFLYPSPNDLVVFGDNHDMDRFFTAVKENIDLFRQGMLFLLTTRGTPQIYYGTEILTTNAPPGDHGFIRSDFPGGWSGDTRDAVSGKGLSPQALEAQQWLRKLLNWRKGATAVHHGSLLHYAPVQSTYVYFRHDASQHLMVVLNKNAKPYTLPLERFEEGIQEARTATDVLSGKTYDLTKGRIELAPMQGLLLELK